MSLVVEMKDVKVIADYLEAKNKRWKNYSCFSSRELVVAENKQRKRLGPSEMREENIILKGVPLSHNSLQELSETGMRDRRIL